MTSAKKHDKAALVLKGSSAAQRNTLDALLNRAIKFRKSRYVDEKLEFFKRKFAPINGTSQHDLSKSTKEEQLDPLDIIDENGFEYPSKVLFSRDKLQPQWTSIRPIGAGLADDLGTMSALNAVLQALTYTPVLANYFEARYHGSRCVAHEYCFACALEEHVRHCLKHSGDVVMPRQFIGKLKKMKTGSSSDPYSVWNFFMHELQSFLLLEKGSPDKRVQETTALCQMFGGYIQDRFICDSCEKTNNAYEHFLNITVDIAHSNSVEKSLTQKFKEQQHRGFRCSSCEKDNSGRRRQAIYRPPMILVIHLDRFRKNGDQETKNQKSIKFEETLDLHRWVAESEQAKVHTKYSLYGVLTHHGASSHGGHTVAYVKSSNGLWHCLDNNSVQQVSWKRVSEQQACMLLYTTTLPNESPAKTATAKSTEKKKGLGALTTSVVEKPLEDNEKEDIRRDDEQQEVPEEAPEEEKEEEEDMEKLKEAAASKTKVDNKDAVVVRYDENMQSKRSKLEALIEREAAHSNSASVKEALLSKPKDSQFADQVDRWDEDIGDVVDEEERKRILRQTKTKRKKIDAYDLEYDRGKVKKVKKKNMDKFNKPNEFQRLAEQRQQQQQQKK